MLRPPRPPSRPRRLATLAGIAVGVLAMTGTAFAATGWTVVAAPASDPNTNAVLNGASARTDTDAWAVGTQFGVAGSTPPPGIAVHWDGTAWTRVATPAVPNVRGTGLLAVSASAATDAWAVGFSLPLSGGYHASSSLFEHWNGAAWSIAPGANAGRLTGVADFGAADAWAVSGTGLVEHWDGAAWTVVPTPHPNPADTVGDSFTGVSADAPNDIWAVGNYTTASYANGVFALHYDGTAWTVVPFAPPSVGTVALGVTGVSAVSPTNVWASGGANAGAYVEHFDGVAWREVPLPAGPADTSLSAIAARSGTDVWAIGRGLPNANATQFTLLFLHWDGVSWSVAPSPLGTAYGAVNAAATRPGTAAFWAVGGNSANQSLILRHS